MPICTKDAVPGVAGMPTERSPIPDGFATAWVLRCRSETRDLPGKGKWTVSIVERADTPATELVAELRKPSDPKTQDPCTLELVTPPYFLLVDASGKAILPSVPTDGCGKPKRDATKPLDGMSFRVLSETPVGQVQSQRSIDTGCPDGYKDMIAIVAGSARATPATPVWGVPVEALRLCVYVTDGAEQVGHLAAAKTIDGDAARALIDLFDKVGPAAACAAPHTRFATLSPNGTTNSAVVELDGCNRLLRPDNTLGQLSATTVAAINAR
jgi:hypothetical protein